LEQLPMFRRPGPIKPLTRGGRGKTRNKNRASFQQESSREGWNGDDFEGEGLKTSGGGEESVWRRKGEKGGGI